jgi:diaminopropionate ammonia-lyase
MFDVSCQAGYSFAVPPGFLVSPLREAEWTASPTGPAAYSFHRSVPGYRPTPLLRLPALAAGLGLAEIHVKDESSRLGTASFKILGCSWAAAAALCEMPDGRTPAYGHLCAAGGLAARDGRYLLTASAGNHGLALARVGAWCGLPCRVFLPEAASPEITGAIAAEGAEIHRVPGGYDTAVETVAALAAEQEKAILISDTSWPGYETVPGHVIDGYSTLFREIQEAGLTVDLVAIQMGVGALAAATVRHYRQAGAPARILGVEPATAACVMASVARGAPLKLPARAGSVMTGLDCGRPSHVAWPFLSRGVDALIAVGECDAATAVGVLRSAGIGTGPTGAAGLAGLLRACRDHHIRKQLGLSSRTRVLIVATEGVLAPRQGTGP